MPFAFDLSWEIIVVVSCLLGLIGGLVQITMRRQTEILKEYLQPEQPQVMPPETTPLDPANNELPPDTSTPTH